MRIERLDLDEMFHVVLLHGMCVCCITIFTAIKEWILVCVVFHYAFLKRFIYVILFSFIFISWRLIT